MFVVYIVGFLIGVQVVENLGCNKTVNNPDTEVFVDDLAEGNYTVRAFSSTGGTYEDNAYVKHTYTHCTVNNLLDNEMGKGIRLDSVRDYQNNWYEVVQIGNQCWLKENMRATTEPTAPMTSILQNPASTNMDVERRAYYYENSTIYSERFGCLYNYLAAMNFSNRSTAFTNPHRGICPEGWHLPTDDEWFTLEKGTLTNPAWTDGTVASTSGLDYRGTGAGRLAAGCDWTKTNSSTTPNSYSYDERNITGFSVFPSGKYESGVFTAFGTYAIFWSTTYGFGNSSSLFYRGFGRSVEGGERGNVGNPTSGFAVRCVRNN